MDIKQALSAVEEDSELVCRPIVWPLFGNTRKAIMYSNTTRTFEIVGLTDTNWPNKANELLGQWETISFNEFIDALIP